MKAYEIVNNGWCQNAQAIDARGRAVDPLSDLAVKFCAIGAINRAYKDTNSRMSVARRLKSKLIDLLDIGEISDWNDSNSRTKKQVVNMLKKVETERELDLTNAA